MKNICGALASERRANDMENLKQSNILHRVLGGIPIIGQALVIFAEHTEMGVSQYGVFLGLLRGAVIGVVIAAMMIAASEAAVAAFDVTREWVSVHITSSMKAGIRMRVLYEHAKRELDQYNALHKAAETPSPETETAQANAKSDCPSINPIKPCLWLMLHRSEKLVYVMGVHDGDFTLWDNGRKDWSFGQLIEKLDKFYSDAGHGDVPVIDGMRIVMGDR
jgi:hypothetical protein